MLKHSKIVNDLAQKLKITNSEFVVILTLSFGLVVGTVYKVVLKEVISYPIASVSDDALLVALDSLAEIHLTTFVGSNIENEPVPELAKADTVVKKETWQQPKKSDFKGVININTASKSQLMQLYRIGEKTAEKIIEHRTKTPFTVKEDIMKVKGIGEKTFERIKDNITV
jgi:competence ComEA-like helix-hairpin-helix protein